jgi:hypothetical protein
LAITIDLSREAQLFVGWVSGIVVQGLSFLRFGLMAGVTGVFYRLGRWQNIKKFFRIFPKRTFIL